MSHQPKLQIDLRTWAGLVSKARQGTINDTSVFKQYTPFSNETYGELNPNFIEDIIRNAEISPRDVFLDIGSGIGNVAIQVATQVGCTSIGVEIRKDLHEIAIKMLEQAKKTLSKLPYPVKMVCTKKIS